MSAALLLGGCDSGLVDSPTEGAPVPQEPRGQKLAEVRLDYDLSTRTVVKTIKSFVKNQPPGSNGQAAMEPRFASLVNGLLSAGPSTCLGCNDGNMGWHQISVPLTNTSNFRITNIFVAYTCGGCRLVDDVRQITATAWPNTLMPQEGYTQSFAVDVVEQKFSVSFNVYGDVTPP